LESEIEFDEKKEAGTLKEINLKWNSIKPDFSRLVGRMRRPGNSSSRERNYFG
jgi:hypothetical protein